MMVIMKYPGLKDINNRESIKTADDVVNMVADSIDSIWHGDEMFARGDYSQQELRDWVNDLSPAALDKIEEYFETMPVLRHKLDWKCKACGTDNSVTMEGMQSFFA